MIDLIMWIGIFIVALAVLIKSSDYFTESSEKIGLHFGIPAFIVGVTIVAFGTSLPELVSSLIAVFAGSSEIVAANVIGSNIANILLVLGIAAIIAKKFTISHEIESVDLPLLVCSAFLLLMMSLDGKFTFGEGVIMLFGIVLYISYAISTHKESEDKKNSDEEKHIEEIKKEKLGFKTWGILVASVFFIFLGAKYTIDSVIMISDILDIGKDIIAVIAVALGTSLPELMVTVSAARKGNAEMAVGNVLGSNIFNSFMVMGVPALFAPWFVTEGYLKVSSELIGFALPIMIIATLLYVFMTRDKKITQWEGWTLLIVYAFFVFSTFGLV